MLALVVSLFFALYILGPDQVSRFVLGFSVPRRAVTLTRSEEVARAVLWSGVALMLAYAWAMRWGSFARLFSWPELSVFFSGVYSEQFFRENRAVWFHSTKSVMWLNWILLWRVYVVVIAISLFFNYLIRRYGRIRHACRRYNFLVSFLATVVLPRIAPWHLLLSRILLHEDHVQIHIDVLTKADILYQGTLADKVLSSDGSLISLTLGKPRRFRREQYLEDLKKASDTQSTEYWRTIPTNIFVLMATEIHSLNLRYVPENIGGLRQSGNADFEKLLGTLAEAVRTARQLNPETMVTLDD